MKIKDVTVRTGLTDKAVRLYIENELITPYTGENYTGRRSFAFSEENVQQLKNIATLRKAGFSLAEIKALQTGGDRTRETLRAFILHTREDAEQKTLILRKLEPLLEEEAVTAEIICESLEWETQQIHVPAEDLAPSYKERDTRNFFIAVGCIGLHFVLMVLAATIRLCYFESTKVLYPEILRIWQVMAFPLLFVAVPALLLLCLGKRMRITKHKRLYKYACIVFSVTLPFSILLLSICTFASSFAYGWFEISSTTNPNCYLRVDQYAYSFQDIETLFPSSIPDCARTPETWIGQPVETYRNTTKYEYTYLRDSPYSDWFIYAEWSYATDQKSDEQKYNNEYILEKRRIYRLFQNTSSIKEQIGDWTVLPFSKEDPCLSMFFAYNNQTRTVRYIAVYDSLDAYTKYDNWDYHLELDWS